MRISTTTRTLISTAAFAAIILTGCNRVSPTEPQDRIAEVPALSVSEAGSEASTRMRPTRGLRPTSPLPATPVAPKESDPTEPSGDPTTPPATPPTTPPGTPPPAMASDCDGPCDGILRVPSADAYMAAIYAARDRVRTAVASGEIKAKSKVRDWNVTPNVEWKACFFWVDNGFYYDANGNRIVGGCAAGMTDYSRNKIVISTKEEARTLALVKWEATNYYLYLIGRKDLLDRWQ